MSEQSNIDSDSLYMVCAELFDFEERDKPDEIYAFKVVRASRYDALAAELHQCRMDLRTYGHHTSKCENHPSGICKCGFHDAINGIPVETPTLICPKCGVNRYRQTCPNHIGCPMHGTTSSKDST